MMLRTLEQMETDVPKMFGLEVGIFFLIGSSGVVENDKFSFMACDYRGLSGYTAAWAVEVRDRKTEKQVYRANVLR